MLCLEAIGWDAPERKKSYMLQNSSACQCISGSGCERGKPAAADSSLRALEGRGQQESRGSR